MALNEFTKKLSERLCELTETKRDVDYKLSDPKQAKQMNIANRTLYNYKHNLCECSIEALVKMAKYYHVTTDYLLGLQGEPTDVSEVIVVTEYTGLSKKAADNLHKYKTYVDSGYMHPETDENGEPCFVTSSIGFSCKEALEIINEFIGNGDMLDLAKRLYELKNDSQEYLEDIDTIKTAEKSIYSHYKKDIDRIDKKIKIDKYEISEFIVHLSDRYDQREQVKNDGNNNPTNK